MKDPAKTEEALEEMSEHTAEVMDDARRDVNRARQTLHDQLLPPGQGVDNGLYEEEEETGPDKDEADETRGAWPNWS